MISREKLLKRMLVCKNYQNIMSAVHKYYKLTSKFVNDYNSEITLKLKESLDLSEEQVIKMTEALRVEDMDFKKLGRRRGSGPKTGGTRAPTKYNLFIQQKIKELKTNNPEIDRKDLMVQAAAAWTAQKNEHRAAA